MENGYTAGWPGIMRGAGAYDDEATHAREVLRRVTEAFARAGRPMGHDHYGAELEKSFPQLKADVIDAFHAHIADLDRTRDGLRVTAAGYRAADAPEA
ncbi:hypothetical protein [Nonomuraea pusilla]|uniref:Excreted virulence factor EspC, type VII ESX diderm n=1 Tax=Nonomuraea pusilla TaxID=46177 RepID=A0A1H7WTP1_9ACTN|nr:hypothetical protein [Nonomuraea pusilla]SEM24318.1 hypothetical protein SAMN05660976_04563 [Nonomuraea pusilla]